jgi:hypothetical protein
MLMMMICLVMVLPAWVFIHSVFSADSSQY